MILVVSLHDVHPSSLSAVERQRSELRQVGVRKFSLLVVPNWHAQEPLEGNSAFIATVSRWASEGDEIVLHGYTHSCVGLPEAKRDLFWTRLYTSREAEFLVVPADECRRRLTLGRALFDSFGWNAVGFIAPAWLMAPHVTSTLRDLGFAYTTTRTDVVPLWTHASPVRSPSLCYSTRSSWRRVASRVWNPCLLRTRRHSSVLRVSLHPGDIEHPTVWNQIKTLISASIDAGRTATTYRDFIVGTGRTQIGASGFRSQIPGLHTG
jgi:uncharacterized protein